MFEFCCSFGCGWVGSLWCFAVFLSGLQVCGFVFMQVLGLEFVGGWFGCGRWLRVRGLAGVGIVYVCRVCWFGWVALLRFSGFVCVCFCVGLVGGLWFFRFNGGW